MPYADGSKLTAEELALVRRAQTGRSIIRSHPSASSPDALTDGHNHVLLAEIRAALQGAPRWQLLKVLSLLEEHAAECK